MSGLAMAAIWAVAVVSADANDYAAAHKAAVETGKPMVVMVSTDWCAPCQMMKKTILPQVRKRGLFKKVVFTNINPDQDRELADQVTGGGPIPQLVMYRKTALGWRRWQLVGGQSVESVEEFLKEGIAATPDPKAKADEAAPQPATKPSRDTSKS